MTSHATKVGATVAVLALIAGGGAYLATRPRPTQTNATLAVNGSTGPLIISPTEQLSAILSGGAPGDPATLWIDGYQTGTPLPGTFDAGGQTAFSFSLPAIGSHTLQGERNSDGARSNVVALTTRSPLVLQLSVNGNSTHVAVSVFSLLTVEIYGGTPNGGGRLFINSAAATVQFDSRGIAVVNTSLESPGTYDFYAIDNTTLSESNAVSVTVIG